jgi:Cd2+/Zn2+-exporting ATPase
MATYTIQGMDCTACAATLEKGVSRLAQVQQVRVDFPTSKMVIDGDVPLDVLRERIEALGYKLADLQSDSGNVPQSEAKPKVGGITGFWHYLRSEAETRLALVGGALIALTVIASLLGLSETARDVLLIGAMLIAAYPIARSGINALLINHEFNINLLMTIAAVGAVLIGETLEGATVIFLFAIGEALEGYTADRARDSLRGLMDLAPAQAIKISDCGCCETTVPVRDLNIGDLILVKPGERMGV